MKRWEEGDSASKMEQRRKNEDNKSFIWKEHIPVCEIERQYSISNSLVCAWVKEIYNRGRRCTRAAKWRIRMPRFIQTEVIE